MNIRKNKKEIVFEIGTEEQREVNSFEEIEFYLNKIKFFVQKIKFLFHALLLFNQD